MARADVQYSFKVSDLYLKVNSSGSPGFQHFLFPRKNCKVIINKPGEVMLSSGNTRILISPNRLVDGTTYQGDPITTTQQLFAFLSDYINL